MLEDKDTTARSKVKLRSHHAVVHLHLLTNVPTMYQLPTLKVSEIEPGQDFQTQGHHNKVKGHIKVTFDVAHLHSPTNVPIKYQHLTHKGF